jgi:hypothetical protein
MAGTEADGPMDDDFADPLDDVDGEPDSIDDLDDVEDETNEGFLAGLSSTLLGDRDDGDDQDDEEAAPEQDADVDEDGPSLTERLFGGDEEETSPMYAELVDGANVYFIDSAARSKELYEYDLVVITAPQYPEPIILKNDQPIEIPEGSTLCAAKSAEMLTIKGKRVITRACTLVPPERVEEVSRDHRVELPEGLSGVTIPYRQNQSEPFYGALVASIDAVEK